MGIYLGSSPISVYMSGQDAGPKRQEKTVTAGTSAVTVTPDSGSLLSKVVVNPTPSQVKSVVPGAVNKTVSPDEGKLLSSVTVEGDADLIAENIRKAINIFGTTGTMEEGLLGVDYGSVTVTSIISQFYGGGSLTINHNLGVVPKTALIVPTEYFSDTYSVGGGLAYTNNRGTLFADAYDDGMINPIPSDYVKFTLNSANMVLQTLKSYSIKAGTYNWVVVA